jgi:GAF domain-containing protein
MLAGLGAGLALVIAAVVLGLFVLIVIWLRQLPRNASTASTSTASVSSPDSSPLNEAVLIVQIGGRVESVNDLAREWFGLREAEYPDLERLIRRARPAEDFLHLCAHQGEKRLSVGGRLVDATSYQVPGPYPVMLISMRNVELSTSLQETGVDSSLLRTISDFGKNISASLDLEDTLYAILINVSHLIPADVLEVKIWDEATQSLIPYTLESSGSSRAVRASHSQFGELTSALRSRQKSILIPDTHIPDPSLPRLNGSSPVQSYLGLPLIIDQQLVGTLEIGHLSAGVLGQHDYELIQLVAPQAAHGIRNALVFASEQNRAAELNSLANLAQVFSASQDYSNLLSRLVETIAPLFSVEILGFLLYDENKRTLEAQIPFQGLPRHIVEIYRTAIEPDSESEKLLADRSLNITRNAAEDIVWHNLGLQNLAQAASLRESVLAPLVAGERFVGYLQLSNHRHSPVDFTSTELRLIRTVADQAAGIIENSFIVERTRQRAMRSDALRRIASLAASTATLDEVLRFSAQELAHLFQSDLVAVFLIDEQLGELRLHRASVLGTSEEAIESLARLHIDDPQYRHTVSGSQKPYMSGRLSLDHRILPVYQPLVKILQVESAIVVPLVVRDRSLGELMLASRKTDFFNSYDLQVMMTAAAQLAAAIENSARTSQTDENLRRRVEQLITVARVSRELNSMVDLNSLLEVVRDESLRTTRAECGTVLLFDTTTSANPPPVILSLGCRLPEKFSPLDQQVVETGEPLLISDYLFTDEPPVHEGVRSALIVPILRYGKTAGLIHLHSNHAGYFDQASLEMMQTLASQAAVALGNVQRYQEQRQRTELLRRRAETLTKLTEVSHVLNFEQPLEQSMRIIANSIRDATPFQAVLISVYERETGMLRRITGIGFTPDTLNELMSRKQPLTSIQQMLKPQFRISRSYFIPVDEAPIIPADVHMITLDLADKTGKSLNAWDPDDFLIIPLEDDDGAPLGLMSVDAPRDGLRPDRATIEALEIFAAQAALAIANYRRFAELRAKVESLNSGLQRQQRLISLTQNDLPILLRKDLDQTIAIQNLNQRSQRVRAGLAITESVSRQLDASSALQALGRETLTQLGMSVALVAETTNEGPRLMHVLGNLPRATSPEALFGQRNPLRACLQTGEAILIPNLDEDLEWRETPLLSALRAKSLICLPIRIDKKAVAAMLAVSPEPMPAFTDEDLQVYYQIARQTSVILQNISLLNETRRRLQEVNLLLDFSRQLRGLDSERIVRALLESARRALYAAHAGVVLIWDEHSGQLLPKAVSGYADNETMKRINYHPGESLPGQAFESRKSLRVDEVQFTRDYIFSTEGLLLYRQATGGRLPVSSLLIPIQSGEQPVGVLVLDNFNTPGAFTPEDETLLLSLSQQVGLSLQNVRLVQTTQERAAQLEALTNAATTFTASLESDQLVASLLDQLEPVLQYDTGTLWLREKDRLIVAAARGFPDMERRLGLAIAVEDSALFKEMIRTGQGILVGDVRHDPRFPSLEAPRLSWLGLPLISKNEVIGVLALEKWQSHFYSREHLQVGTTFASQAAVSLENARLFKESLARATELDQRSQRLALLNRFSSALSGLLDEGKILQLTAQELIDALYAPSA